MEVEEDYLRKFKIIKDSFRLFQIILNKGKPYLVEMMGDRKERKL